MVYHIFLLEEKRRIFFSFSPLDLNLPTSVLAGSIAELRNMFLYPLSPDLNRKQGNC